MRLRALAVCLALASPLTLTGTDTASAEPVADLAFPGADVVAVADRLFVAQASWGTNIQVLDLQGNEVALLGDLDGPGDMTLTADGERVLVPLRDDSALATIDPETLAVTRVPVGGACPTDALEAGGRYWFNDACGGPTGAVDPATGEVTLTDVTGASQLAATPTDPNALHVLEDRAPDRPLLTRRDAATGLPLAPGRAVAGSQVGDLAVSPDGTEVVAGTEVGVVAYDSLGLGKLRRYERSYGLSSLAFRADGLLATIGGIVRAYPAGTGELMQSYDRWARSGAFVGDDLYYSKSSRIERITPRHVSEVVVNKLTGIADYRRAEVRIKLRAAHSTNRSVEVYYLPKGGTEQYVRTVQVPEDGTVDVKIAAEWHGIAIARYAGDEATDPATGTSDRIHVRGKVTNRAIDYLRKEGDVHLVRTSGAATIVGRVLPERPGDKVYVSYQFRYNGQWQPGDHFILRLNRDSRVGLRLTGRPSVKGLLMRMWVSAPENGRTFGGSGEPVLYRWVS